LFSTFVFSFLWLVFDEFLGVFGLVGFLVYGVFRGVCLAVVSVLMGFLDGWMVCFCFGEVGLVCGWVGLIGC
jgi:hypothetical protein